MYTYTENLKKLINLAEEEMNEEDAEILIKLIIYRFKEHIEWFNEVYIREWIDRIKWKQASRKATPNVMKMLIGWGYKE